MLGNQELTFDVSPALVNVRVPVPLRKIFETQGAKVADDEATGRITAWKGPITVELKADDPAVLIDRQAKRLDRTAGPYDYVCTYHGQQMEGQVIVTGP